VESAREETFHYHCFSLDQRIQHSRGCGRVHNGEVDFMTMLILFLALTSAGIFAAHILDARRMG
jgi:hypothetical protein